MSPPQRTPLRGTEEISLELTGELAVEAARALLGDALAPELRADGGANVGLLVFRMKGLRFGFLPGPGYHEALWRIGAIGNGQRVWVAVACHIDRALVRALGRSLIGYPTRQGRLDLCEDGGALALRLEEPAGLLSLQATSIGSGPPAARPRRTLVRSGKELREVPWGEGPAKSRHDAVMAIQTDELSRGLLGAAVQWDRSGVVLHGRAHRCGLARPAHLD